MLLDCFASLAKTDDDAGLLRFARKDDEQKRKSGMLRSVRRDEEKNARKDGRFAPVFSVSNILRLYERSETTQEIKFRNLRNNIV